MQAHRDFEKIYFIMVWLPLLELLFLGAHLLWLESQDFNGFDGLGAALVLVAVHSIAQGLLAILVWSMTLVHLFKIGWIESPRKKGLWIAALLLAHPFGGVAYWWYVVRVGPPGTHEDYAAFVADVME